MPKKLVRAPFPGSDKNNKPVDPIDPATTAPERGFKAATLKPYVGKPLEVTWGLGSQQAKQTVRGKLREVTERHIQVSGPKPGCASKAVVTPLFVPLAFLVRFSEVFD